MPLFPAVACSVYCMHSSWRHMPTIANGSNGLNAQPIKLLLVFRFVCVRGACVRVHLLLLGCQPTTITSGLQRWGYHLGRIWCSKRTDTLLRAFFAGSLAWLGLAWLDLAREQQASSIKTMSLESRQTKQKISWIAQVLCCHTAHWFSSFSFFPLLFAVQSAYCHMLHFFQMKPIILRWLSLSPGSSNLCRSRSRLFQLSFFLFMTRSKNMTFWIGTRSHYECEMGGWNDNKMGAKYEKKTEPSHQTNKIKAIMIYSLGMLYFIR